MCQLKCSVFVCWKLMCDLACFIIDLQYLLLSWGHSIYLAMLVNFVWQWMEEEKLEILSKIECNLITFAVHVSKSKRGFLCKLCGPIFWTQIMKFTAFCSFLRDYARSATLGVVCWWAVWMKDCWPLHLLKSVTG